MAMEHGHILQLEECDAMQPEVGFILQQVLEPTGHLLLTDTGEDIAPRSTGVSPVSPVGPSHTCPVLAALRRGKPGREFAWALRPFAPMGKMPMLRVATANTLGFGCDSGLYASGTNVLNFSWIDRWDVVVHLDYLPEKHEVELLHTRHPSLKKDLLKCIVKAVADLRKAHAEEQLTTVVTTRRLLAPCARLVRGNAFDRALTVCVLNKAPQEDAKVLKETFEHHVGPLGQSATGNV